MLTLEQAKALKHGDVLHHTSHKNADGTPQRWKVIGEPKTWKRSPTRVEVSVKCGAYSSDYLTEHDLHLISISKD